MGALVGRGYMERAHVISGASLNTNGITSFSREIPLSEGHYSWNLLFTNVFVVGTGSSATADGDLLIIKNILIRTDRGEILCNLPGRALHRIAQYKTGVAPIRTTWAASSATYYLSLPIYFADFKMLRPEDTVLDTSRYSSLTLQIQLGTTSDLLGTPGTSTATYTFDLEVERSLGILPAEAAPLFHINYDQRPPIDAYSASVIDYEKSSDLSIKRSYVFTGTSGTAGVSFSGTASDAVVSSALIKDQGHYIEDNRSWRMVQNMNAIDSRQTAVMSGLNVFDWVKDKSIAASIYTGNKSVLQYSLTAAGGLSAGSITSLVNEGIRTLK